MKKLFIDSDIILDLVQEREYYRDALALFILVEENNVAGFVSPLIFANLFYILRKQQSATFAYSTLTRLKALLNIVAIDEKTIGRALTSGFRDFEDAIQYFAAIEAKLDFLITRNKADYRLSGITVCTAGEFLAMYQSGIL